MKMHPTLAALPALAGLLALPFAQDHDAGHGPQKLAPLAEAPQAAPAPQTLAQAEERMRALGASTLAEREQAWRELVGAARRDPDVRRQLGVWADDPSDVDRAWNARLLLRELQLTRDPLGGLRDPFRDLWGADPFADPFGGGAFGRGGMGSLFEDMQRQIDELLRGGTGATPFGAPPPGGSMRGQQFQLESGPDGVKVRVTEDVDGKTEEKTYEAGSLEELLEAYPELKDRIGVGPGLGGDARGMLEDMQRRLGDWGFGQGSIGWPPRAEVPTDRLGILMREPGSYSASVEGLEPGVGLLVESVMPSSIAGAVGLQKGDIVVELNGTKLTSAGDVHRVLAARGAEEPVVLKIVDALGQQRTLTWQPAEQQPGASGPLKLRRM